MIKGTAQERAVRVMADYISRDDVIKKIAEVQDKATSGTEDVTYFRAIKIIRDMPASDVQPVRHGRWIEVTPKHSRCSICDTTCLIAVYPISKGANYCPNCGARMDGDKE